MNGRRLSYRKLLAARSTWPATLALLLSTAAFGGAPPAGWETNCGSCHGSPYVLPPSASPSYGKIIGPGAEGWLSDDASLITKVNSSTSSSMDAAKTFVANPANAGMISEFRGFLLDALNGTVSPPAFNSVAVGNSSTGQLIITNFRSMPISYDDPTGQLNGTEFSITTDSCGTGATRQVPGNGGSCTLALAFTPTSSTPPGRSAPLQLKFSAAGTDGKPADRDLFLTGMASSPPVQPNMPLLSSNFFTASVDMDRPIGEESTAHLIIANTGGGAISSITIAKSGAAANDYSFTENCSTPATIPAPNSASTCFIDLSFKPTALGVRQGTLNIAYTATSNGQVLNLPIVMNFSGIIPPVPKISLTTSMDFGSQGISNIYPPKVLTLTNTGATRVAISSLSVAGTGFSLVDASPCPASLPAGANCKIRIGFAPSQADTAYAGTLTVVSNAEGSPHSASLAGRGTIEPTPVLSWSPASGVLDFGSVSAGTSLTLTATLLNPGPSAVILQVANTVGLNARAFQVVPDTCKIGDYIAAGESCDFKVTFAPPSAGDRAAELQAGTTGSAPGLLALRGSGLGGPASNIRLSVDLLKFDPVKAGANSAPQMVTIRNSGSIALRVSGIDATGSFSVAAQTCPAIPFALEPGFDCTLSVTFAPRAAGAASGVLTITSDAAETPALQVTLSGQGDPAPKTSGGGGCSLVRGDVPLDPTLWALALAAVAVLAWRRRDAARGIGRRDAA
ncbi:MAG: choice-of-anchor D domain-containing protein [Zoogloea sp.]|nr:MAG: choice-of-anchor D domain-containing protein [Zoogloea sp.]